MFNWMKNVNSIFIKWKQIEKEWERQRKKAKKNELKIWNAIFNDSFYQIAEK